MKNIHVLLHTVPQLVIDVYTDVSPIV